MFGPDACYIPWNRITDSLVDLLDLGFSLHGVIMRSLDVRGKRQSHLFRIETPQEEVHIRGRIYIGVVILPDGSLGLFMLVVERG